MLFCFNFVLSCNQTDCTNFYFILNKGSINSCGTLLNTNQVCHPETVDVLLKCDENGTFGFTLQGGPVILPNSHIVDNISSNNNNNTLYPVVGYVEPNSSAEKSGLMQPGDRIISINNRSLESLSIDEARQIIKESGSQLILEIEFDIAGRNNFSPYIDKQ